MSKVVSEILFSKLFLKNESFIVSPKLFAFPFVVTYKFSYIEIKTILCIILWICQNIRMSEFVAHKNPVDQKKKFTILVKKFTRNILLIHRVLPVEYNSHTSVSKIAKMIKF